jgi:UDP-N-acetylglucosamine 2-epimerase
VQIQKLFLASNIDAGSDGVSVALRDYRKSNPSKTFFLKGLNPEDYYKLLANTAVAVGNSSSFIREGAFLGTPAVIVGDRQKNRERCPNAIETPFKREDITSAISKQMAHGKYPKSHMFGDGQAAGKIVNALVDLDLQNITLQKNFKDTSNE